MRLFNHFSASYSIGMEQHLTIFLPFITGLVIFVAVKPGQTLSLTQTLFPGSTSSLPPNSLLNMTFDCTTKQLVVHTQVSEGIQVIPQVLSLSNLFCHSE